MLDRTTAITVAPPTGAAAIIDETSPRYPAGEWSSRTLRAVS
jgi:hypothetical protein